MAAAQWTMGSPHPLSVSTGPGRKLSRFVWKKNFVQNQSNLVFHLGLVQPPGGERSLLGLGVRRAWVRTLART